MTQTSRTKTLILRLYVAGASPNSVIATRNVRAAISHLAKDEVSLAIIDVLRDPERSLNDGVVVTPTLVKVAPGEQRRVLGTLGDRAALLACMGLAEVSHD